MRTIASCPPMSDTAAIWFWGIVLGVLALAGVAVFIAYVMMLTGWWLAYLEWRKEQRKAQRDLAQWEKEMFNE